MTSYDVPRASILAVFISLGIGQSALVYGADGTPVSDAPTLLRSLTEVTATWSGGTGNWTTANWTFDPANGFVEPNNTATHLFNVFIDGGLTATDSVVSLNVDRSIQRLNVDAGDRLIITNSRRLSLFGDVINHGLLRVDTTGSFTVLQPVGTVTLSGSGVVEMGGNAAWLYDATDSNSAPDHLIQQAGHSIRGIGNIGRANELQITNRGLIHADTEGGLLNITPSSEGMVNTGVVRASIGGVLRFDGSGLGTSGFINNAGGVIEAGAGSTVSYINAAFILGGELTGEGRHVIDTGVDKRFEGLTNRSTININNARRLSVFGELVNEGVVRVDTSGSFTVLQPVGTVTLSGSGAVEMGGNAAWLYDATDSNSAPDHLIQQVGHSIRGIGNIGSANRLRITNRGLIHADTEGGRLNIFPNSFGMANTGVVRASAGGTLTFDGAGLGTTGFINNAGGVIEAGAGSTVSYINAAFILGGELTGEGRHVIDTGVDKRFEDLTNRSTININNFRRLSLFGELINEGVVRVDTSGSSTFLQPVGTVTLSGSGVVEMGGNAAFLYDVTDSNSAPDHLIQQDGHSIRGIGNIGSANRLQITNRGLIHADTEGGRLNIIPNSFGMVNTGVVQSSAGGILTFDGDGLGATGFINNAGGVIEAGAGSTVAYIRAARIVGGELIGSGTHAIDLGADKRFEDLINRSTININNARRLSLFGELINEGVVRVDTSGSSTFLQPVGTVTLSGSGVVEMGGNLAQLYDLTDSNSAPDHLIQQDGHTILGIGNIGSADRLRITNLGLIHADTSDGTLNITPNSFGIANSGTLRASGGGTLNIATSHGSLSSLVDGQLLEGRYEVIGDSIMRLGAAVNSNDAVILLDGPLSRLFSTGSTDALANFVSNQGSFTIRGGRLFSAVGDFDNSGMLRVGAGSIFTVAEGNTLFSWGALAGSGRIVGEVVNSGLLTPGDSVGTLTIEGEVQIIHGSSYEWQISGMDSDLVRVVNGDLVFSGGTVTIDVLVGELPPPMGRDHVLIDVSGGVIEDSVLPEFSLNLPASWTSDGVQVTNTQVVLRNLVDGGDVIFRSRFEP